MDHPSTRAEHLEFCKKRALELCDAGDLQDAVASMLSDMKSHPDTKDHIGLDLGLRLMMAGHLSTAAKVRDHIEGYN